MSGTGHCFPSQVDQSCAWRTAVFRLCPRHWDISAMLIATEAGRSCM